MGVEKRGEREVKRALNRLLEWQNKDFYDRVAIGAKKIVITQTRKGLDVDGSPFVPYAKTYNKKPRNPVNLKRTGAMLGAVTGEGHKDHARVFVEESGRSDGESNLALAVAHDDGNDRVPKRHWFGIGKQNIKKIYKIFEDAIDQVIRFANR